MRKRLQGKELTGHELKSFCILPWIHLNVLPNGSVIPCCISPYDDIYGDGTKTWTLLNTHVKHIDHLGHVLIYRKDLLELFKD